MSANIVVPELGESVIEATISHWLKQPGDRVTAGEPLVELETEKVNLEVGAERAGVLARIERQAGEDVRIGDVLGVIEDAAEAEAQAASPTTTTTNQAAQPAPLTLPPQGQAPAPQGAAQPEAEATADERAMVAEIKNLLKAPVVDLTGSLSLKELAALTAHARAFVGVDSAPMHMAAAMQTPTVALFGPSSEVVWGPWGVVHRIVASTESRHSCRPCNNDGCGGSKVSECLTQLPVVKVTAALNELLALS